MSGNVCEWCWDLYNGNYENVKIQKDPTGFIPENPEGYYSKRIIRGGTYLDSREYLTVWYRENTANDNMPNDGFTGFRLVRSIR